MSGTLLVPLEYPLTKGRARPGGPPLGLLSGGIETQKGAMAGSLSAQPPPAPGAPGCFPARLPNPQ